MINEDFPLIFERSKKGRISTNLPPLDVPVQKIEIEEQYIRNEPAELPDRRLAMAAVLAKVCASGDAILCGTAAVARGICAHGA